MGWTEAAFASSCVAGLFCRRSVIPVVIGLHTGVSYWRTQLAELLGAIVGLFVAFVELLAGIVGAVLEALGIGVASLATKPEKGESRFSGRRLLVAIAPLVSAALLIGGVFGYFHWQDRVRRERTHATQEMVETSVEQLARKVDENGHFVKHPTPTLNVDDAWGNPLHVAYDETLTSQRVVVRSAGDDETVGTWDDVSSSRRLPRKKREIAMDLLGKAKDAIVNKLTDDEAPNNNAVNRSGR